MQVRVSYEPERVSISATLNSRFLRPNCLARTEASFVIDEEISDANTFLNFVDIGNANDPTPQPASHTVFFELSSLSIHPSTLSIVC